MSTDTATDYDKPAINTEPPNGSVVVIEESETEYKTIWREDVATGPSLPDERWFDNANVDGMSWAAHLKYGTRYWVLNDADAQQVTR